MRLLKEIVKRREVTIGQLREMIPRKFGDHRDYYEIAGLITSGFLETPIHEVKDQKEIWFSQMKEYDVALEIYSMTLGPGDHKYLDVTYQNPSTILDQRIFPTGKAFLHFNLERQIRIDRIFALVIGITVGIVTAVAAALLTAYFPGKP